MRAAHEHLESVSAGQSSLPSANAPQKYTTPDRAIGQTLRLIVSFAQAHQSHFALAVRAFVEAVRFLIHHEGVDQNGLKEGRRGVHGVPTAAEIWGVSQFDYMRKADPWPLNPKGELLLGVKEEDKYALANVEENLKVPGLGG